MEVRTDPRVHVSLADLQKQFTLVRQIQAELTRLYGAVNQIWDLRSQTKNLQKRLTNAGGGAKLVLTASQDLDRKVAGVEDSMVQIKISANEDSLRYPPGLDARLSHLVNTVGSDTDSAPTEAAYREFDKLKQQVDQALASWSQIVSTDVASFDKLMQEQKVNPLLVQQGPETTSGGSK